MVQLLLSFLQSEIVIHTLMWCAHVGYLVCFFPQMWTNFKTKSGTGMSELLLIGYLNMYLFVLFYVFCMNLPLAYKIMVPLQAFSTVILILQRLLYDQGPWVNRLRIFYALNIGVFLFFIPRALQDPLSLGHLFGWLFFAFALVNQLPQVVKIYQEKSVAGFSFLFVLFTGLAGICETIVAFASYLPMQTKVSAIRVVCIFMIFCTQFLLYKK